ncbi:MAG: two-component system response regulator OmpR [Sedimenticola sp.]|nr:MAG: two-component system response regulator OmpR [Sedimenticola sp.]
MSVDRDNSQMLILVVDDDPGIRRLLTRYLNQQNYKTAAVSDGKGMERWLQHHHADLIILDLMLPGEDGLSLIRKIRLTGNIPIIMLTAKGEEVDRVIGLESGADDYLSKPFSPRELLARIRAVLRRHERVADYDGTVPERIITFGEFSLSVNGMELLREGKKVELTSGEMDLLIVLAQSPGRVLSRDQLMDRLKGGERDPFDRSIDVRITRLRSKIEPKSAPSRYIQTVWGKGYCFTPNGKTDG